MPKRKLTQQTLEKYGFNNHANKNENALADNANTRPRKKKRTISILPGCSEFVTPKIVRKANSQLTLAEHPKAFKVLKVHNNIGKGASGIVTSAICYNVDGDKENVAIKTFMPLATKTEVAGHTRIYNLSDNHPGIVNVIGISDESIIMELSPGTDLFNVIDKEAITFSKALEIMKGIIDAVIFLRKHGLSHGDIKPENVMLDDQAGIAKLVDFGSVAGISELETESVGTASYAAPEVFKPKYSRVEADNWSLAVTFIILMAHTSDCPEKEKWESAYGVVLGLGAYISEQLSTETTQRHANSNNHTNTSQQNINSAIDLKNKEAIYDTISRIPIVGNKLSALFVSEPSERPGVDHLLDVIDALENHPGSSIQTGPQ